MKGSLARKESLLKSARAKLIATNEEIGTLKTTAAQWQEETEKHLRSLKARAERAEKMHEEVVTNATVRDEEFRAILTRLQERDAVADTGKFLRIRIRDAYVRVYVYLYTYLHTRNKYTNLQDALTFALFESGEDAPASSEEENPGKGEEEGEGGDWLTDLLVELDEALGSPSGYEGTYLDIYIL